MADNIITFDDIEIRADIRPEFLEATAQKTYNLFDKTDDSLILCGYIGGGGVWRNNTTQENRSALVPCEPNTQYTVYKEQGDRFKVGYIDSVETSLTEGEQIEGVIQNFTATRITITTGANAKMLVVWFCAGSEFSNYESRLNSLMVVPTSIAVDSYYPGITARDDFAVESGGWLKNGDDLNSLYGVNRVFAIPYSAVLSNDPIGASSRRTLIVLRGMLGNNQCCQIIVNAATGQAFIRHYANDIQWTNWVDMGKGSSAFVNRGQLANGDDLNSLYENGWYLTTANGSYLNEPYDATGHRRILAVVGSAVPNATSYKYMFWLDLTSSVFAVRLMADDAWGDWLQHDINDKYEMKAIQVSPFVEGYDIDNFKDEVGFRSLPYSAEILNSPIPKYNRRQVKSYKESDTFSVQELADTYHGITYRRLFTSGHWYPWAINAPFDYVDSAFVNVKFPSNSNYNRTPYDSHKKVLTLLHFSDLHGDYTTFTRFMAWANQYKSEYAQYGGKIIDDLLCTGDIVDYYPEGGTDDYMDFWYNTPGAESILVTIGNHDAKDEAQSNKMGYLRKSIARSRELYFKGIDTWNVTSPSGTTYWYKDYDNCDIRLIGLDTTIEPGTTDDANQLDWFEYVLDNARSNNKAVVVAQHYPAYNKQDIACDFTTSNGQQNLPAWFIMTNDYMDLIESFMSNGGTFICHLAGHLHDDRVCYNANYPNQIFFAVTALWCDSRIPDQARIRGTRSEIAANLIGFDTEQHLIKIVRVGANYDVNMRPRNIFVYDYQSKEIVRQSSDMQG